MQKNSEDFSMQEALRLAKSPAGQQLLAFLQSSNNAQVRQAIEHAAAGDYEQAKQSVGAILASPEAKKLLEQLGG